MIPAELVADRVEGKNHALTEQGGSTFVARREAVIGEQAPIAWVEE
jgi:hypothetical protein